MKLESEADQIHRPILHPATQHVIFTLPLFNDILSVTGAIKLEYRIRVTSKKWCDTWQKIEDNKSCALPEALISYRLKSAEYTNA
jgi:hypothetical protein